MKDTVTDYCPECGEECTATFIKESHSVHNGIGMQTVAEWWALDDYDRPCDCELTLEQEENLFTE